MSYERRLPYSRPFIPLRLASRALPVVLYHTPDQAETLLQAAEHPAVKRTHIYVERITSDPKENNEIEKVFAWQKFVSGRSASRDIRDFGINDASDAKKYRRSILEAGYQRINDMADMGKIAVFKCITDIDEIGLRELYSRYDELTVPKSEETVTIMFRQGTKIVTAHVVDTPGL